MMQKSGKNILKIAFIIGVLWLVKYLQDTNYYSADIEMYRSAFSGVIQNRHLMDGEFNIPVFEVLANDGKKKTIVLSGGENDLFAIMENGDSLIKRKNSYYCVLIKDHDTLELRLVSPIPEEVLIDEGLSVQGGE